MAEVSMKTRILVADDEMSIRMGCDKILKADGHEVVTVEDGILALQAFDEKAFDLVLLDLMMPRMDGLTVIPELIARDPNTVIIMITGYASFETAVKAIQLGAYDYVPKPFTPNELKIVIRRALERRHLLLRNRELQFEREKSLKDLALEKGQTRTIINAMPDALMVINTLGDLVLFNPAARAFLKDEVTSPGRPLAEALRLSCIGEAFDHARSRFTAAVKTVSLEINDQERKKTFLMNAACLPGDDGESRGVVLVFSDISPMKDVERAKTRFVSVVAHELKAPVGAIEGYLDLILMDLGEGLEKYRPKLERCRDRAGILQRMIRELLDISRIEQGRIERSLERLDPWPIVVENVEFLKTEAQKRNVRFELVPGPAVEIFGDRGELTQVLTNLVSNAIKYNRENGCVTVTASVSNGFWRLAIADTGIGISPENLKHLGEDFYRVKSAETINISGTGLGIAIIQRLLEMSHARLEVESTLGQGSTFTVCWPLESPQN